MNWQIVVLYFLGVNFRPCVQLFSPRNLGGGAQARARVYHARYVPIQKKCAWSTAVGTTWVSLSNLVLLISNAIYSKL